MPSRAPKALGPLWSRTPEPLCRSSGSRSAQLTPPKCGNFGFVLRLNHVNLGVPIGGTAAEVEFLVDFLGYRRVTLPPDVSPAAKWFESDDEKQIHLSEDPKHRPAARAHVAVDVGDDLVALERKLEQAGYEFKVFDSDVRRTVFCQDPAGNQWELRGTPPNDQ